MKRSKRQETLDRLHEQYTECAVAHQNYDEELQRLLDLQHRTEAEQERVRDLKKLKLKMKDAMANLRAESQNDQVT